MKENTHIILIAGEASGDKLGAGLVKALRQQQPSVTFSGMGSQKMRDTGVDIFLNCDDLAVVGGLDVLTRIHKIYAAKKRIQQELKKRQPNLVILIDYPGFNLRIAKLAKKMGFRVMFYVSPQVWAWRYHRVNFIRKYVDHMAVLFPFEEKIYHKAHIPVACVGHPLVDEIKKPLPRNNMYPRIGLLPGSRNNEIARHLPILLAASQIIQKVIPNAQFVIPVASNINLEQITSHVNVHINSGIEITRDSCQHVLPTLDCAITVSGTVTLELALHQVPMTIIYRMDNISYFIAKYLLRIKVARIGLCNIVAEKMIVKEWIQDRMTPENIAGEILKILAQTDYRENMMTELAHVREYLGPSNASKTTAEIALSLIEQDQTQFYSFSAL